MPLRREEVAEILNGLLDTCQDGIDGFRTAATCVTDQRVRAALLGCVTNIEHAQQELRAEVQRLGGIPEAHGTVEGALHRGWIDLKSAGYGHAVSAVLDECERGEQDAVRRYEMALVTKLPRDTRVMVARQRFGVLHNLERVRALERATTEEAAKTPSPADGTLREPG
jgi:uncharacterized protein (TIGR02284 family)